MVRDDGKAVFDYCVNSIGKLSGKVTFLPPSLYFSNDFKIGTTHVLRFFFLFYLFIYCYETICIKGSKCEFEVTKFFEGRHECNNFFFFLSPSLSTISIVSFALHLLSDKII